MRQMISAIVLTKNSVSTFERTIASLAWCDEVIIVDDESTDKTVQIAKKNKAQAYSRALHDDFAQQRNFGLSKIRGDWVLFVDSDEVVSDALRAEIQEKVQVPSIQGYYVKRRDFLFGRWLKYGETAGVRLLRLARKNAGVWVRPVHEVWEVKGQVGELVHPLLHYPHPWVREFLSDINWYSTLNARCLKSEGRKSSLFEIVLYPLAKFKLNYFFRFGFLDGMPGILVAILMSFHSFLVRAKLYLLWNKS